MKFLSEEVRRMCAMGFMGLAIIVVVSALGASLSSNLYGLSETRTPIQELTKEPVLPQNQESALSPFSGFTDSLKNTRFLFEGERLGASYFFAGINESLIKIKTATQASISRVKDFFYAELSRDISGKTKKR